MCVQGLRERENRISRDLNFSRYLYTRFVFKRRGRTKRKEREGGQEEGNKREGSLQVFGRLEQIRGKWNCINGSYNN